MGSIPLFFGQIYSSIRNEVKGNLPDIGPGGKADGLNPRPAQDLLNILSIIDFPIPGREVIPDYMEIAKGIYGNDRIPGID